MESKAGGADGQNGTANLRRKPGQVGISTGVADRERASDGGYGLAVDPKPSVAHGSPQSRKGRTDEGLREAGYSEQFVHFLDPGAAESGIDFLVKHAARQKGSYRANARPRCIAGEMARFGREGEQVSLGAIDRKIQQSRSGVTMKRRPGCGVASAGKIIRNDQGLHRLVFYRQQGRGNT